MYLSQNVVDQETNIYYDEKSLSISAEKGI